MVVVVSDADMKSDVYDQTGAEHTGYTCGITPGTPGVPATPDPPTINNC